MRLRHQSPTPQTPPWSHFYRCSSAAIVAGMLTFSAACSAPSETSATDTATNDQQPISEHTELDPALTPLPAPAESADAPEPTASAPTAAPAPSQADEATPQVDVVSPPPPSISDIDDDDERLATLDALIAQLDFTTARTQAAQWATETEDGDLRHLLDERARLYSSFVQQEHQVRSNLALLSGNHLQRQAAMVELLRGGPLIEMFLTAVIQPTIEVSEDDASIVVTVVELAQAMGVDVFPAALQRHQHSPAGALRDGISDYLIAVVNDDPQSYAKPLWAMATTAEPATISNLLPTLGNLLAQPDFLPEGAPEQFRTLIIRAAETIDDEKREQRGAIFATALELGDDDFTTQVMKALGPGGADIAGLPPGWSATDIGEVETAGSVSFVNGAFVVRGAGENFWGSNDGGHMAWRRVSGDVSFRAQLKSIDAVHDFTKAGISFRRTLDADSVHGSALASPGNNDDGYRFVLGSREETGGSSNNSGDTYLPLPHWIQLRKAGEEVIAEVSVDGENWDELSRRTIDLGDEFYLGVVVSARRSGHLAEAIIEVPLEDLF